MKPRRVPWIGLLAVVISVGCNHPEEKFGRTWYLDGAGNWGFGVGEMVHGLRKAGYKGQVSAFLWSLTMSPVADQVLKLSGPGAARLAGCIDDYFKRYPGNEVNVIALSAGADVALQAVKRITPPNKVENVILLAPSVSCRYEVGPVLKNMRGKIYVYHSTRDGMLAGPVRVFGSFGGKVGDEPAGLVGLHSPNDGGRVVNVGWRPRFERYGWHGSHTSCTSEPFVQYVLSAHIVTDATFDSALAQAGAPRPRTAPPPPRPSGDRVASAARNLEQPKPGRKRRLPSGQTRVANMSTPQPTGAEPVRPTRPGSSPARSATSASKRPKPRPAVFAPPLDDVLSKAMQEPVARPGRPATFVTLSRRDPRFPGRGVVADGLRLRLIGVPGATSARIEIRPPLTEAPQLHRMTVDGRQRCDGTNGKSWTVTLLRVDPASQTAWVQIRPTDAAPRRSAKRARRGSPTT